MTGEGQEAGQGERRGGGEYEGGRGGKSVGDEKVRVGKAIHGNTFLGKERMEGGR